MSLKNCMLIDFPQIQDPRGSLTFVEGGNHIPFDIQRVYYLYNVPTGSERGGHAHKILDQIIFALSGCFRLKLDDGQIKRNYWMKEPHKGLYISNMVWHEMDFFSPGTICLVLASHRYDEADYYRNYNEFLKVVRNGYK